MISKLVRFACMLFALILGQSLTSLAADKTLHCQSKFFKMQIEHREAHNYLIIVSEKEGSPLQYRHVKKREHEGQVQYSNQFDFSLTLRAQAKAYFRGKIRGAHREFEMNCHNWMIGLNPPQIKRLPSKGNLLP